MKNLFKISLFAMGVLLSSASFSATGTGHAQTELTSPLSVKSIEEINFGVIAIDPSAGPQTVVLTPGSNIVCPETYVCSGASSVGKVTVLGAPSAHVLVSIVGSTATLSDGVGHTLVFDPIIAVSDTYNISSLNSSTGEGNVYINGEIDFTGDEPAGVYNTTNAGGSGYTVTLNY